MPTPEVLLCFTDVHERKEALDLGFFTDLNFFADIRRALNWLPVALWAIDENDRLAWAEGGTASSVMGCNLRQYVGQPYEKTEPPPELRELMEIAHRDQKCAHASKLHESQWFDIYCLPVHLERGPSACLCTIGLAIDHTGRWKELSHQIGQGEALRLKSDFAVTISQ